MIIKHIVHITQYIIKRTGYLKNYFMWLNFIKQINQKKFNIQQLIAKGVIIFAKKNHRIVF